MKWKREIEKDAAIASVSLTLACEILRVTLLMHPQANFNQWQRSSWISCLHLFIFIIFLFFFFLFFWGNFQTRSLLRNWTQPQENKENKLESKYKQYQDMRLNTNVRNPMLKKSMKNIEMQTRNWKIMPALVYHLHACVFALLAQTLKFNLPIYCFLNSCYHFFKWFSDNFEIFMTYKVYKIYGM